MKTQNILLFAVRSNIPDHAISFLFSIALLLMPVINLAQVQNLSFYIQVEGIKNNKGQLILDIYKDEASFKIETPFRTIFIPKTDQVNGSMVCKTILPEGTYGIALIDDEDMDSKIKRNFFGYPQEGYGFSNMPSYFLRRPKFDEFTFPLDSSQQFITIVIHYSKFY
jgi:uncharacterized protein (DUF2141 family)